MTDHDEKAKGTPASDLTDLPPKDLQATDAGQVVGGAPITQASHETKKAIIGNLPR